MDTRKTSFQDQEQSAVLYVEKISPVTHRQQRIYQHDKEMIDEMPMSANDRGQRPISVLSLKGKKPHRFEYLRSSVSWAAKEIYQSLWTTFSFDKIDFGQVKKNVVPVMLSGITLFSTEYLSQKLSEALSIDASCNQIAKFMFSAAILQKSFTHSVTEEQIHSFQKYALQTTLDILAITYLYSSTYTGSVKLFEQLMPEGYAFLASLAMSGIIIPGAISCYAQKSQQTKLIKQYQQGAQRSDTALISSGFTHISNAYLQANRLLVSELSSLARIFQLGLISNNIISDKGLERQFRNLPAIVIDVIPQLLRKLFIQFKKVEEDYTKNTSELFLLTADNDLQKVKRHQLRTGDLVWCGDKFDGTMVPVSGDILALERDRVDESKFTDQHDRKYEYRVNLKTYSGENTWIKNMAENKVHGDFKEVDQRAIQDSKQLAILNGAEIDFLGRHENFFIRVNRKKELLLDSSYEKKSVINQIISQSKKNNINYALSASVFLSLYLGGSLPAVGFRSVKLLFSLFQMMIPFSEAFLREMINSQMVKQLNNQLGDDPIEMIDALRIVDFLNAINQYYKDKFPKGVAIISDKTGTLTTTTMAALGFWTKEMKADAQSLLKDKRADRSPYLVPGNKRHHYDIFEVFAAAFTDSDVEMEPEEHAILSLFQTILGNDECLKVDVIAKNHFKKHLQLYDCNKDLETVHLGLYTSFGGRFTLVNNGHKKSLVFCGIPRQTKFANTNLLHDYNQMKTRHGVLSRDWCIAVTELKEAEYQELKIYFDCEKKQEIEKALTPGLMQKLNHVCTFLVDNPVKTAVEKFIPSFADIGVPVIVATGDTAKAAENIARVLCNDKTDHMITIKSLELAEAEKLHITNPSTTVIFAGINPFSLVMLDDLLSLDQSKRPAIIFSEMTTKNKGELASYLKEKGYFIVANGDGSNDIEMMKAADFVIAHLSKEGKYAPGISQYANLNDRQLQKVFASQNSFYELFDVCSLENSYFMRLFLPLANAQEMVTYALIFKTIKMSLEFAKSIGVLTVNEIWNQQWLSIIFDLLWLWIAYHKIIEHAYVPVSEVHLVKSWLPSTCLFLTVAIASMEAASSYYIFGTTTDISLIIMTLAIMPTLLSSFFSGFNHVQDEIKPMEKPKFISTQPMLLIGEVKPDQPAIPKTSGNPFSFITSMFKKPSNAENKPVKNSACVIS